MSSPRRPCPRCGRIRSARSSAQVCADCRDLETTEPLQRGKYLHRFPILDPDRDTADLICEGRAMLRKIAPNGYTLERCEWHRRPDELLLLADAVPEVDEEAEPRTPVRWVKDGLVWRAQKVAA